MAHRSQLRVYYGPDDSRSVPLSQTEGSADKVDVPLAEILETLGDALINRRAWIDDFRHDQVTISTDLYEVIAAYKHLRRSA